MPNELVVAPAVLEATKVCAVCGVRRSIDDMFWKDGEWFCEHDAPIVEEERAVLRQLARSGAVERDE